MLLKDFLRLLDDILQTLTLFSLAETAVPRPAQIIEELHRISWGENSFRERVFVMQRALTWTRLLELSSEDSSTKEPIDSQVGIEAIQGLVFDWFLADVDAVRYGVQELCQACLLLFTLLESQEKFDFVSHVEIDAYLQTDAEK